MAHLKSLRKHLVYLLAKGGAHATFEEAVKDVPAAARGKKPEGAAHSLWDLVEHMRIAQSDILQFSSDAKHKSPKFPNGYWPKTSAPPSAKAWDKSIKDFLADRAAMCELIEKKSDRSIRGDPARRRTNDFARSDAGGRSQCLHGR